MYLSIALGAISLGIYAQDMPESIRPEFGAKTVRLVPSPIKAQVLFVGGVDMVQTTDTYGNPAGETPAKQWHDFIGFTPDTDNPNEGWITVNHEMIEANDMIGDGGGMTSFKVRRSGDTLEILEQTLNDGRTGKFFNVDFANTVGETGMNCGGICSPVDGRIWTAEEWFRTSNRSINPANGVGVRDTSDFTLNTPEFPEYDGRTVKKFENMNYMVEIDPRQAKAIRKQYNWGRQPFEGGTILPDNRTVILGPDNTPGYLGKFYADSPGDFTKGKLYIYKHDDSNKWIEIDNSSLDNMINHFALATQAGATMYNRIEWSTFDPLTNAVYFTCTGSDSPGNSLRAGRDAGAVIAPHHEARALNQGLDTDGWSTSQYRDYYGRIMKLDLSNDEVTVFLEGGPDVAERNAELCDYPEIHLSNPDGITTFVNGEKSYLIIQEDLNGDTYGRTPFGTFGNFGRLRTCEMFALDLSIQNPTIDDLVRIAIIPHGAEVTGAIATADGRTLLVNAQHPSEDNPFPYNNSLTLAINGIDEILAGTVGLDGIDHDNSAKIGGLKVSPNPATREVTFSESLDVAIYNVSGQRLNVYRGVSRIDVSHLVPGTYFLKTTDDRTAKLIVQ